MTPEQLHQIDQARRYAEQDEYVVTRTHIRNLLAIIDEIPPAPCRHPETVAGYGLAGGGGAGRYAMCVACSEVIAKSYDSSREL